MGNTLYTLQNKDHYTVQNHGEIRIWWDLRICDGAKSMRVVARPVSVVYPPLNNGTEPRTHQRRDCHGPGTPEHHPASANQRPGTADARGTAAQPGQEYK